jgi:hypothetical protein
MGEDHDSTGKIGSTPDEIEKDMEDFFDEGALKVSNERSGKGLNTEEAQFRAGFDISGQRVLIPKEQLAAFRASQPSGWKDARKPEDNSEDAPVHFTPEQIASLKKDK